MPGANSCGADHQPAPAGCIGWRACLVTNSTSPAPGAHTCGQYPRAAIESVGGKSRGSVVPAPELSASSGATASAYGRERGSVGPPGCEPDRPGRNESRRTVTTTSGCALSSGASPGDPAGRQRSPRHHHCAAAGWVMMPPPKSDQENAILTDPVPATQVRARSVTARTSSPASSLAARSTSANRRQSWSPAGSSRICSTSQ